MGALRPRAGLGRFKSNSSCARRVRSVRRSSSSSRGAWERLNARYTPPRPHLSRRARPRLPSHDQGTSIGVACCNFGEAALAWLGRASRGLEGRFRHRGVVEVAEGIRFLRDDRGDGGDDYGGDEPGGSSRRLLLLVALLFAAHFFALRRVDGVLHCCQCSGRLLGAVTSCETPLPSNAAIYRRHNATSTTSDAPLVPWQRCTLSQV